MLFKTWACIFAGPGQGAVQTTEWACGIFASLQKCSWRSWRFSAYAGQDLWEDPSSLCLSGSPVSQHGNFFQHNTLPSTPTVIAMYRGHSNWYWVKKSTRVEGGIRLIPTKDSTGLAVTWLSRLGRHWKRLEIGKRQNSIKMTNSSYFVLKSHKSLHEGRAFPRLLQYSEKQLQPRCMSALIERSTSVVAAHLQCNIGSKSSLITTRTT